MKNGDKFYINGKWVSPEVDNALNVLNPANEDVIGQIQLGSKTDVDKAVQAA